MDRIILNIPKVRVYFLNDLLKKEEEVYSSIDRSLTFYIQTSQFFNRINELEKEIYENFNEIIKEEKEYLLNFIKKFKDEHYKKVMEEKKFSCYLSFSKNDNINLGLFGWIPKFYSKYLVSLKDFNYEKLKKHCFLTEEEEKFKFNYKTKFNFLSLFFKDEYYYNDRYNIPTEDLIKYKRRNIIEIRQKCCDGNFVCPRDVPCKGHKFINFLEKFFEMITYFVVKKKFFYRYILFKVIKKDNEIFSWDFIPAEAKDISHLSFSKRLALLN